MESAALTRRRTGIRDSSARTLGRRSTRSPRSPSPCCAWASSSGFLVFPTYPNYDSYYSLLWGREVLDLQAPFFEGFRVPTEHPLAIAAGALLSLLGEGGDRVWVAMTLAAVPGAGVGDLPARAGRLHAAGRRDRRAAAADALRLRVPRRARLRRRARTWRSSSGRRCWRRRARAAAAPVFALLAAGGAAAARGVDARRPVLPVDEPRRERGASARATRRWPRSRRSAWAAVDFAVTGDPLFSLHYTSSSAEDLGRQRTLGEIPSALPYVLREPRQAAGAARRRSPGSRSRWLAAPRRAAMPLVLLLSGHRRRSC